MFSRSKKVLPYVTLVDKSLWACNVTSRYFDESLSILTPLALNLMLKCSYGRWAKVEMIDRRRLFSLPIIGLKVTAEHKLVFFQSDESNNINLPAECPFARFTRASISLSDRQKKYWSFIIPEEKVLCYVYAHLLQTWAKILISFWLFSLSSLLHAGL